MPTVLDFNAELIREKFDRAAGYLGVDGGFEGFQAFVQKFNDDLCIPRKLGELGVSDPDIDELVEMALADPSVGGNPREMTAENTAPLFLSVM